MTKSCICISIESWKVTEGQDERIWARMWEALNLPWGRRSLVPHGEKKWCSHYTQNDKCKAQTSLLFHLNSDLRQTAPWRTAFLPSYCQGCARFSFRGLTFGHQVLGEKYPILSFLCSHCSSWPHPRGASCLTGAESAGWRKRAGNKPRACLEGPRIMQRQKTSPVFPWKEATKT